MKRGKKVKISKERPKNEIRILLRFSVRLAVSLWGRGRTTNDSIEDREMNAIQPGCFAGLICRIIVRLEGSSGSRVESSPLL